MIKLFIFVLLFPVALKIQSNAQGHWERIPSPTDKLLRYVFFVDSANGWAAGAEGQIIHTSNGGDSWEIQNSTVSTSIVGLFFLDVNTGWALTWSDTPPFKTIVLKTTNSGSEWTANDFPAQNVFMRTIFFFDEQNGWIGGTNIMGTTDGGTTWFEANVDSNLVSGTPVFSFNFYSRQYGFATGGFRDFAGVVWRTTDFGASWQATGIAPDPIYEIFIADSLNLISLSGDPEGFFSIGLVKSTDAGDTWSFDDINSFGVVFSIKFRTRWEGWAAAGPKFLLTTDGGNFWSEVETPDSTTIFNISIPDLSSGFAVGDSGVILKYIPPPVSVDDENNVLPDDFVLYQNYPNPFNPVTKIRYTIGPPLGSTFVKGGKFGGVFVNLKVYDVLGNEIATLVNESKPAGIYEVEFDAEGLTSGIYYYQLRTGSFVQTKKMVYLR